MVQKQRLSSAKWLTPNSGVVSLSRDWKKIRALPPLHWAEDGQPLPELRAAPPMHFADKSGYFTQGDWLSFVIRAEQHAQLEWKEHGLFVGGEFNGWEQAIGKRAWKLEPVIIRGRDYYLLNVQLRKAVKRRPVQFKFVTGKGEWLEVPAEAPNAIYSDTGIRNWLLDPHVTGHHIFFFTTPHPLNHAGQSRVVWKEDGYEEDVLMMPGDFLFAAKTFEPLGVEATASSATFRLFAPRATSVEVSIYRNLDESDAQLYPLERSAGSLWSAQVDDDLRGAYYHYHIDGGARDAHSHFNKEFKVLDPYALATVGPLGPGIIVSKDRFDPPEPFDVPAWQDLIICEAHVRDLAAKAPIPADQAERRGFTGLRKWVESSDFYLSELGINCVELQPVQQNDAHTPQEYHWGYMTNNYFSPNAFYGLEPEKGSQIEEFRQLVDAFHKRGIAVILDVVYNHVGEPNFLQYIDKHYYFDVDEKGAYVNWSGCGNTLRCETPMGRRLVIESLLHLMRAYGVDGFRFDLAELIGVDVLRDVERELKKENPKVILIAEPWSFRGHIGHALKKTGFASWNDGYRDFIRKYILGHGNIEGLEYFLGGSLAHLAAWPAQSVNYLESHDDMCWMDMITENASHNASAPTRNDQRRTHLMIATLMMSLGMPMISAGQDFLRSKRGHHNTYQRGDINALDYGRQRQFSGTHEYFRSWIHFRKSALGEVLRPFHKPGDGFIRFFTTGDNTSVVALYNADGSMGRERLLFAINPHFEEVDVALDGLARQNWIQIADHDRFDEDGLLTARFFWSGDRLRLPALSCGLWVEII